MDSEKMKKTKRRIDLFASIFKCYEQAQVHLSTPIEKEKRKNTCKEIPFPPYTSKRKTSTFNASL